MFPKAALFTLALLATSQSVLGRFQILERDGNPVFLYPRRFGQEQPEVLRKLGAACPGQVCGTLAGKAVTPLLAAQPECSQQDLADEIIDASKQFDAATQANMLAIAIEYRQVEKNTPPDFTTNPPSLRNSVFCQKAPKNAELNGLVQAQDPNNDPNLFFDPALGKTVLKGSQANTAPFNGGGAAAPAPVVTTTAAAPAASLPAVGDDCPTEVVVTVTVTGANPAATNTGAVTVTAGQPAPTADAPPAGVDFGKCSVPQIEFAAGFDNRRETSFRPVDPTSFTQGSAQNINIITRAMCDQLTNTCGANQAAKDLCASAQAKAGAAEPAKTGIQADVFNAEFGITTNFAAVAVVDDQGRTVSNGATAPAAPAATTPAVTTAAPVATAAPNTGNNSGAGIGNFGSCSVPEITFGAGIEGRRETSFIPTDLNSYNHGSAQNIDIITQFICDTLVNKCNADQTAKDTCARARTAVNTAAKGTGGQADAFNAVFGKQTNFVAVTQIDNTGNPVPGTGAAAGQQPVQNNGNNNAGNNNNNNNNTGNNNGGAQQQAGNLQSFTGALGGVQAPVVTALGNGQFQVANNAAFNNRRNALVRSCDVQNNQCANAANASGNQNGFNVGACNAQQAQCIANANATA